MPMTRTQFGTYRGAFASLLKCTSSEAPEKECIDGWIGAIRPLTAELDETFSQMLMEYYVKLLRGDTSKHCA
jgi:hypothetical protein